MGQLPQSVQPSTLRGIKRLAKDIKKQDQIPHLDALEVAAKRAGYQNYQHAKNELEPKLALPPSQLAYSIYLSAYWYDTRHPRNRGLETLKINFPRPLAAFLKRHQIHCARNLEDCYLVNEDHLEMRSNHESQKMARKYLHRVAMTLQFIEATGIHPATNRQQRAPMDLFDTLPHKDHDSRWISPAGDWLFLDEPYSHAKSERHLNDRANWLARNGFHGAWPTWAGLHSPNHAQPHFTTPNPALLNQVVSAVQTLRPVIEGPWEQWPWICGDYSSQFISPAQEASGRKRKPRPGSFRGRSKNAYPYQAIAGHGEYWKPAQPMSLHNHKTIAKELNRLLLSKLPLSAYDKLRGITGELENWLCAEANQAGRDSTDKEHDIYYGGETPAGYTTDQDRLAAMDRIRTTLTTSYPDCKPLRDLLKGLARARALTEKNATR